MAPPNRHKKQLKVEEPEEEENEDITNTDESESGDESDSSNESNSSSEEESDDNEDEDVEERKPVDDDRNSIGFSDKELVRVTYQLPLRLWNWLKKTEPILKEQGNVRFYEIYFFKLSLAYVNVSFLYLCRLECFQRHQMLLKFFKIMLSIS